MVNLISDSAGFKVDNESGTLTDIGQYINNMTHNGGQALLDDTGLGDSRHTSVRGLANATEVTINGWVNTTTEAIFAPLLDGTSVQKTIETEHVSGQYLYGEAWPRDVTFSVSIDALQTFSCTFQAEDGLARTSVAQS